jgi:pseudouridine kinase
MSVAAFGAIHLDTIAHADRPILRETSTPARLAAAPGGVAANVARALARLGTPVALAGRVGRDAEGDALVARLAGEGVDTEGIGRADLPTGRYLALHDPDGALAAAVVDGRITDAMTAADLLPPVPSAGAARIWFIEANLPAEALAALSGAAGSRLLAADAVSRAKAPRLAAALSRLDLLFCNAAEAAALLGREGGEAGTGDAADLARALRRAGARRVVLTQGAGPALLAEGDGIAAFEAERADVVDVTGAGDALVAGTLAGLARNLDAGTALRAGLTAARLTLGHAGAVAEALAWERIAPRR